jgi:SAM-dependent methyltransferase
VRDLLAALDDLAWERVRGVHRLHEVAARIAQRRLPAELRTGKGKRLNLGASERRISGYVNVDSRSESGPDVVSDVRDLSFADEHAYDVVRASHVLEHFEFPEMAAVLAEWRRVLRPGGYLVVCVPNNRAIAWRTIVRPKGMRLDDATYANGWIQGLFALQLEPAMRHKAVFDRKSLTKLLAANGFTVVCSLNPWLNPDGSGGYVDNSMSPLSLNLLAQRS